MQARGAVIFAAAVSAAVLWAAMPMDAQGRAPRNSAPTVTISTGQLLGATADGVTYFKGIPYALPPVGNLRWRPPQPAAPWKGAREAVNYGADCMQLPFPPDAAPLRTTPSEDCLYVNVWRPATPSAQPLPVMVWIYGGGYVNGGSSPAVYDGSQFARQGLVFVSFNYRLGRFGFFAFPGLTAESGSGPTGNFGFMDQIAALQWVQKNIAAFGGDPHQVTIFGESAGGGSVHALLGSPLAKGLFQRAMIESGGGRNGFGGTPTLAEAEQRGVAFAQANGIQGTDAAAVAGLRALPAATIVGGMNMASMDAKAYSGPMIDGRLVVADSEQIYRAGEQMHIPVVVGANNHDLGLLRATSIEELWKHFGPEAEAARAVYDASGNGDVRTLVSEVGADAMMVEPARFVAQALSAQGLPVWEFRFSYVAGSLQPRVTGAGHATEIPYVFDTVRAKYGAATTAADETMAQTINTYWANFAKTGDPNGAGLPHWPRYSSQSDMLMNFAQTGAVAEADPWKARLDVTAQLANGLMKTAAARTAVDASPK